METTGSQGEETGDGGGLGWPGDFPAWDEAGDADGDGTRPDHAQGIGLVEREMADAVAGVLGIRDGPRATGGGRVCLELADTGAGVEWVAAAPGGVGEGG